MSVSTDCGSAIQSVFVLTCKFVWPLSSLARVDRGVEGNRTARLPWAPQVLMCMRGSWCARHPGSSPVKLRTRYVLDSWRFQSPRRTVKGLVPAPFEDICTTMWRAAQHNIVFRRLCGPDPDPHAHYYRTQVHGRHHLSR
jgi:hypothetical protein